MRPVAPVHVTVSSLSKGRLSGLLVSALCLAMGVLGVSVSPASASASGTVGVDMVINTAGTESRAVDIAAGAGRLFVIKYSCSGAECDNVRISLPLADHTSIGGELAGGDWTESRSGSVVTWAADSLPAGTSSQITFTLTSASGVLPEGSVLSHTATISALGNPAQTSDPVTMTVHAGGSTNATAARMAGGAVDAWTTYRAAGCLVADPNPAYGQLGVQSGSVLTMTLPVGAVVKESGGATVNGRVLSWTLGGIDSAGCSGRTVKVAFPSSDPANTVGSTKTLGVSWDGAMVGGAQIGLGSDTKSWQLDAQQSSSGGLDASISTTTPQLGDSVTQSYSTANGSNTVWDSVRVDAGISGDQTPTGIDASASRGPGTLWIAVDGGALVKAADVAANAAVHVDPYAATLPSGAAGLVAPQTVTAVRFEYGGLQPGDSVTGLSVTSRVRTTTTSGTAVSVGDHFSIPGTFTLDDSASPAGQTDAPLAYTIVQPMPVITVRSGGGGTIANGANSEMDFSGYVSGDDLPNPVIAVRIPKMMSYVSWSRDTNSSLPAPSMTKIDSFPATGQTLLRFTWPTGTVMPRNTSYDVHVTAKLGDKAYGDQQAKGFFSSATADYACGDGWFVEGPDTQDLDGNGNTTRALCAWGANTTPITNVGAQVVQSIKGSWDSDYTAGPATSYSSPGSSDSLRTELQNTGNIFLRDAVVVTKLPRPGDDAILSSGSRNPTTSTFPVDLDGVPVLPSLGSPVDTYWTTDDNACLPELSYSPTGCTTPTWTKWSDQAPTRVADVSALKFDFGSNRLTPFDSWSVDIPVTTPTSGATEQDYAVSNPVGNDPAGDEKAVATSAAVATREDISSALSTIESTPVTLAMPGGSGPYSLPAPTDVTSTGAVGVDQTATLIIPAGGSVSLLDGGSPVTSNHLTVTDEGTYVLDPDTGVVTFTPEAGFIGRATAVTYQVTDSYGATATATYRPRVTAPPVPNPANATSSGTGTAPQSTTFTRPPGGQVSLVDPHTLATISSGTVTVPGVGSYVLTSSSGKVTFTPAPGYAGTPDGVVVAVEDTLGQVGYASYVPTVVPPTAPSVTDRTTSGTGTIVQHVTLSVGSGEQIRLLDGNGDVVTSDHVTTPGQGTYHLDRTTGQITFTPMAGYAGTATPVTFQVEDAYGQTDTATYTALVQAPAAPSTPTRTSSGPGGRPQSIAVTVPSGGSVALWNGSETTSSITVPDQGVYAVDAGTGRITFTPASGFTGAAAPVSYQVTDAYGQASRGTYQATVNGLTTGGARPTTVTGHRGHEVTASPLDHVTSPAGQSIVTRSLRVARHHAGAGARSLRTASGRWTVRRNGHVVFRPVRDYVGVATVFFHVRTSDGTVYRSTISVVVKGVVTGRVSATVYFALSSARLTQHARAVLRHLAGLLPELATTRALSVGYVQPERNRRNDLSLSRARARHVAGALSRMADLDHVRISGRGRATQRDWRARRATVTVRWRLVQR